MPEFEYAGFGAKAGEGGRANPGWPIGIGAFERGLPVGAGTLGRAGAAWPMEYAGALGRGGPTPPGKVEFAGTAAGAEGGRGAALGGAGIAGRAPDAADSVVKVCLGVSGGRGTPVRVRTLSRSAWLSNGFTIKSSAFTARARF